MGYGLTDPLNPEEGMPWAASTITGNNILYYEDSSDTASQNQIADQGDKHYVQMNRFARQSRLSSMHNLKVKEWGYDSTWSEVEQLLDGTNLSSHNSSNKSFDFFWEVK